MGVCIIRKSNVPQVFNKLTQSPQEEAVTHQQMICKHTSFSRGISARCLVPLFEISWGSILLHFVLLFKV